MANTTNFGWETPDDTDLVKDGAAAIRTLGSSIDTSFVDLKGGTTGQVLSKTSNTDLDFTWVAQDDSNAIQNAIVDAKGDLITATAADTPARLASSGVNGEVLTVDTSTSTGLKWAAVAGGSLTILSTTTASGTSTVISSINQTYTNLLIIIEEVTATSANTYQYRLRNGATALTVNQTGVGDSGGSVSAASGADSHPYFELKSAPNLKTTGGDNAYAILIYNYASTTAHKPFQVFGGYMTSLDAPAFSNAAGYVRSDSAIDTFVLTVSGSATGGTIRIYGVK